MFVTISGDAGSGKTTVGKIIAQRLGYEFISMGDFMGEIAKEKGLSLMELSKQAEQDPSIDKEIDEKQQTFGQEHDDVVFDSRLGWYFIPKAIKIYLTVHLDEGAKRIYTDPREDEKENTSLTATKEMLVKRKESEKKRYQDYYGVNYTDKKNFDIVIDTTYLSIEEVASKILRQLGAQTEGLEQGEEE